MYTISEKNENTRSLLLENYLFSGNGSDYLSDNEANLSDRDDDKRNENFRKICSMFFKTYST